ncbi:type II toxin-antitoxin system RelE/ParE family toxin [Pedobacter endophyticus]|uniref:Type II toxin-antitoxin system YafQ family toxin n=1 Tax=Pedobacter endophyticus TaxID=2789740 RepID=A0A7S9L2T3_9SPHI|nr:type II toxin-antitoxin system YafQ family toxin [Pedobacter endophyticus]QPH41209.1 type II toxin-antitoxin system YafQ family toxin [Pedobacter endophyticus]
MFTLKPTNQFKKDAKRAIRRASKNFDLIEGFLEELKVKGAIGLEKRYLAHRLAGNYRGNWEAHIKPDLLIIWFEVTEDNEIILLRLGTHSDLF